MTTPPTDRFDELLDEQLNKAVQYPIRQKAAHTPRPASHFERHCATCGASFVALAPGTTGERGIWRSWVWYCSQECDRGEQRSWPA